MNRIFRWLETLSSRPKEHDADDGPKSSGYAQEPQEHAPMPDIYTNEDDATVPDLKTLDPDSPDTDKSDEFDPDDTVVLQKK